MNITKNIHRASYQFDFKMTSGSEVLAYINPIFFYYCIVYGLSEFYQWLFSTSNAWQYLWNKVIDTFGDDKQTYSVWIINSYAYLVYWIFGSILFVIEVYNRPDPLKNFKIQQNSGVKRLKNIQKV